MKTLEQMEKEIKDISETLIVVCNDVRRLEKQVEFLVQTLIRKGISDI